MIRRADWLAIIKDRVALSLLFLMVAVAIALIVTTILRIHPSDIQVPVRFTAYGQSNIDRDQWYVHLGFGVFGLLLMGMNGFLAMRLHAINRMLSIGLIQMTIFLLVLALIIANAVFNLAPRI